MYEVLGKTENPYRFIHRGAHKKEAIVIHETAGSKSPTPRELANWFLSKGTGSHYYVDYEGNITQLAGERLVLSHCQEIGSRAIGIDCAWGSAGPIRTYRGNTYPVSGPQIAALFRLMTDICARNDIPLKTHATDKSIALVRLPTSLAATYRGVTSHLRWYKGHACGWLHEAAIELCIRGVSPYEAADLITGVMAEIKPRGRINLPPRPSKELDTLEVLSSLSLLKFAKQS